MEVKQKSIKDIEKISDKYLLKRIKSLTESDFQVSVNANRLYEDFDISLVKDNFETGIFISKINSRLGILYNKELLKIDENKKYFLSQKGKDYLKPFYIKNWFIKTIIDLITSLLSKVIKL